MRALLGVHKRNLMVVNVELPELNYPFVCMYVTGADEGTNAGGFVVTVVVVHACIQVCMRAYLSHA
jgi:hypothetical protein